MSDKEKLKNKTQSYPLLDKMTHCIVSDCGKTTWRKWNRATESGVTGNGEKLMMVLSKLLGRQVTGAKYKDTKMLTQWCQGLEEVFPVQEITGAKTKWCTVA